MASKYVLRSCHAERTASHQQHGLEIVACEYGIKTVACKYVLRSCHAEKTTAHQQHGLEIVACEYGFKTVASKYVLRSCHAERTASHQQHGLWCFEVSPFSQVEQPSQAECLCNPN